MKKVIILLVMATTSFATFAQTGKDKMPMSKKDTAMHVKYTCTMHPEVVSDKPGKCPKCGMTLVVKHKEKHAMGMDSAMHKMPMQNMHMHKIDSTMTKKKMKS